jgi:SH3 domain-containing YSC84-like protein 1
LIVRNNRVVALLLAGCLAGSVLLAQAPKKGPVPPPEKQQELVTEAGQTLENFLSDPEMTWFKAHQKEALGFLISPMIMKAGFILGGSGGRAVLIAKGAKGWHGPAFYTLATPSIGFQAGVEKLEFIAMVMTKKGLDSLMKSTMKIGGDASFAIGPVGAGAGSIPKGDFVIFTRTKGVYGGVNVEGTGVKVTDDFNKAYYGEPVTPLDIIARGTYVNPAADAPLLSKIAKAGK